MKDVIKSQNTAEEVKTINGRKVRVNRRARRSNLKGYYALAGVLVAVVALFLSLTVFFKIQNIEINGLTLYTTEQILTVGGVQNGANLIRTDTGIIKQRLEKTLPYIDSVTVEKKYPSTIVITCTEAEKAADIKFNDAYYVLSTKGKILEAKNPTVTGKIPVIKGFQLKSTQPGTALKSTDSFKGEIILSLMSKLKKLKFTKITAIDITTRSDIKLMYDKRIQINMGSSADMEYKLTYLKAVIKDKLPNNYEGTLIYNGADSGISAIPKGSDSSSKTDKNSSSSQSSSSDSSADTTTTTTAVTTYVDNNYTNETAVDDTTTAVTTTAAAMW